MKREIKFRVWTGEEMITPPKITIGAGSAAELIQIDLEGSLSLRNAYGLDGFGKNPTFDDPVKYELMEYTGLKDKDGKEIYEGDIVSIPYVDPIGSLHEEEDYKSKVIFLNGSFVYYGRSGKTTGNLSNWCKVEKTEYVSNVGEVQSFLPNTYLAVIGNIFENPEIIQN